LPSRITLDELAEQYDATPDDILAALTVRTKVQDDESELSLKDVIKGYQTEKYTTRKSQELAEKKNI
jgi:hypothetical protein